MFRNLKRIGYFNNSTKDNQIRKNEFIIFSWHSDVPLKLWRFLKKKYYIINKVQYKS